MIRPMIVIMAAIAIYPAGAVAEETGGAAALSSAAAIHTRCASIHARGLDRQMNLRASEILVMCGVLPGGAPNGSSASGGGSVLAPAFPGSDIDVITGTETSPRLTQSESFVWSHESTIVVNYNDARGDTESPVNRSGVSVSHDGGATFARLGPKSPLTGHGANIGDPIVVYNAKLGKWFAGDLTEGTGPGCGIETNSKGIGLWTSTNGEAWTVGSCAHVGSGSVFEGDDRESMWVDNNSASTHYGRMYISFNNFSVGEGALQVTHSDDGASWSTPLTLYSAPGFRRDVQLLRRSSKQPSAQAALA
jgi:hypothetical protein